MKPTTAVGVLSFLFLAPCFAGDLENGIKAQERKDHARAVQAFQRAAANGSAEAQRRLGFMYYHGEGIQQDNERAVTLFEKAAEGGDRQSVTNLAKMYEFGMTVAQDDARAFQWYRKAAEMGDPHSQFDVSVMFYKGRGVDRNVVEAAKWWTLAMMCGGKWAESIRPSVESAESKLTAEEIAEGKSRAADWARAHEAK